MPDPHRVIADAEALLQRVSPEGRQLAKRARQRRYRAGLRTAKRLGIATAAIVAAILAWGLAIGPIGQFGFLGALLALIVSWAIILFVAHTPEETPERLAFSDLAQLPGRTETWLQGQRAALPAPAARLVDGIGLRLEALAPQLAALDPREPIAGEARKLLANELPELIQGYSRVPVGLRKEGRDGPAPDRQLVEGLSVIESELARMSEDLAKGDLHRLATQNRYLELKYKDDPAA